MKTKSLILIFSLICITIAGVSAMIVPGCEKEVCKLDEKVNSAEIPSMLNVFIGP